MKWLESKLNSCNVTLFCVIVLFYTYEDAQPISGFSQRSLVSNSIFHFLVLLTPDCMALRAGTKI